VKVAHFIGSMNVGGSENLLMNILRNIDREKYELVFIENVPEKTYYTDEVVSLGGKIIKTPSFSVANVLRYYIFLKNYFKNNNIDVVHSHTYLHSWIVLAAAKHANIQKRIAHAHSAMVRYDNGSSVKHAILRRLLKYYATRTIACSEAANNDLFDGSGDSIIIKNPVDLSRFDFISDEEVDALGKKVGIVKNKTTVIGHIGRMVDVKNPFFILEIMERLQSVGADCVLVWLGDGMLRGKIEAYIKEHNLSNVVKLVGNTNHVAEYIGLFDVFIMPSIYEGLSLAAIEVQSLGVPCVLSSTTSPDTKVNDNVTFLPIDNPSEWASYILSRPEKIDVKDAHENIVNEGMDVHSVVEKILRCYED